MIELERRNGSVLRIGHRGAAALAPENTIQAFRAAHAHGVDLIEFDVIDLRGGPLVLAHSDRLDEVSHGAATGTVRDRTLAELREVAPSLPTLDEALAFFVDEAPGVGLHVDLKLATRLDELAAALRRFGLERRTVVSSTHAPSLHAVARYAPDGADRRHLPGGPATASPGDRCSSPSCARASRDSARRCRPASRGSPAARARPP